MNSKEIGIEGKNFRIKNRLNHHCSCFETMTIENVIYNNNNKLMLCLSVHEKYIDFQY